MKIKNGFTLPVLIVFLFTQLTPLVTAAPLVDNLAKTKPPKMVTIYCTILTVEDYPTSSTKVYVSWANCKEKGQDTYDAGGFISTRRTTWRVGEQVKLTGKRSGNLFTVSTAFRSK